MKNPVIKFQNVTVRYADGFCAARAVSFEIGAGECLAIVGESGGGKTTVARAALGLLPKSAQISGSIKIGDTEIIGARETVLQNLRGLKIGFVAQEPFSSFNPLSRIYRHISEAWLAHNRKPPHARIIESLERFGIAEAEKSARQFPHEWSGGMLQRATVVAASAHHPPLIIADEPTSALDANRADEILAAICRRESAVLLVTHDIGLATRYADRLAVCYRGEIVEIGATAEIIKNPQHFYTKILLAADWRDGADDPKSSIANDEVVLEAKNLSRHYRKSARVVRAVNNVNLQIRRGEIVGVGGASGSGKSTLLRLLSTIETPTGGAVYFGGELAASGASKKITGEKARKNFLVPIFQDPSSSLDARWAIWRSVTEPLTAAHRAEKFSKQRRREIARESTLR